MIVQGDVTPAAEDHSTLCALDLRTGRPAWKADRPMPQSWATPAVVRVGGRMQIITVGDPLVAAYDAETGAEVWGAECLHAEVAPSPVFAGGLVLAVNPYTELVAIQPDGKAT